LEVRPIVVWIVVAAAVMAVSLAFRLPERMGCVAGVGRHVRCQHGLLAPESWRRP